MEGKGEGGLKTAVPSSLTLILDSKSGELTKSLTLTTGSLSPKYVAIPIIMEPITETAAAALITAPAPAASTLFEPEEEKNSIATLITSVTDTVLKRAFI